MNDLYFRKMYDLKRDLLYWEIYLDSTIRQNRIIKIILATVSSGSVAAWAIWQKYPMIWAIIIALSQVLSVIYDFLPYQSRINDISALITHLSSLYIDMEEKMLDVQNEFVDDKQKQKLIYDFERNRNKVECSHFVCDSLPLVRRYQKLAEKEAKAYYAYIYNEKKNCNSQE